MRWRSFLTIPYIAGGLWVLVLSILYSYYLLQEQSLADTVVWLFRTVQDFPYSPLLYVLFYIIQPLIFFPSTLLTIIGGAMFGIQAGFLYAFLGANLSVVTAYTTGTFLVPAHMVIQPRIQKWTFLLRHRPFLTTLLLRLLFVPFDIFNYTAGILRVPLIPFWLATMLGTGIAIAAFVTLGASVAWQDIPTATNIFDIFNTEYVYAALGLLSLTFILAYLLKQSTNR